MLFFFTTVIFSVFCFIFLPDYFSGDKTPREVFLDFGNLNITFYALLIGLGILISTLIAERFAKKENTNLDEFYSCLIFGLILGIIGTRLYYVVFNLDYYLSNPRNIIMLTQGGLAIHGGILFVILSVFIYTKRKKIGLEFFQATDYFTLVLPFGHAIGRWGNFFNQEAFGTPTDLPWKMFIEINKRPVNYRTYEFFHPTFLYESIFNLLLFFLLIYYIKYLRKNKGEITFLYLMLYPFFRTFIEMIRTDSLMIGNIKANVLISLILAFVGLIGFVYLRSKGGYKNKNKNKKKT